MKHVSTCGGDARGPRFLESPCVRGLRHVLSDDASWKEKSRGVEEIVEEWRSQSKRGRYESAMWKAAGLEAERSGGRAAVIKLMVLSEIKLLTYHFGRPHTNTSDF